MIANKIIPSFFIIEVEGKAVESIISGDFGIQKIVLGSKDFETDLAATGAMQEAIDFITQNDDLDLDNVKEQVDFNPEFFPSIAEIEVSEKKKLEILDAEFEADEMSEKLQSKNQMAIAVTRVFDQMGDYVESRWTAESTNFKIVGKVGVNPDQYLQHKIMEKVESKSGILKVDNSPSMVLH